MKTGIRKPGPLFLLLWILLLSGNRQVYAQFTSWVVDSTVDLIDGTGPRFSQVHPGDTLFIPAGNRDKLLIRNLNGGPGRPVIIMNKGGTVHLRTSHYYGLSVSACRYLRITGAGSSPDFCGFQINEVRAGAGIGIGNRSSDIEIDHLLIEQCATAGIYAKTDPDCSLFATRENFIQFNTVIHDNTIRQVANEGMYIGSSFYSGMTIRCNGKDTLVEPPVLKGVQVYNNKVAYTGWDAIQVSSAVERCAIYGNTIEYDSQSETDSQMSGILIGGGSQCDCSHNLIRNGKGDGIEDHGLGSNRIFNNIIVDAGRSYFPDNPAKMKHGIFVSDVSVLKDSAFTIAFNTIIRPKSDGIRFQSVKSNNSLIVSNLIAEPGNYDYYGLGLTGFRGNDAFVMRPSPLSDVRIDHNFFTTDIKKGMVSADFIPLTGSPLINQGYQYPLGITNDFRQQARPCGDWFDIGAIEYTGGPDTLLSFPGFDPLVFPNPAHTEIRLRYLNRTGFSTLIMLFDIQGVPRWQQQVSFPVPGIRDYIIPVQQLTTGIYIISVRTGTKARYVRMVKL